MGNELVNLVVSCDIMSDTDIKSNKVLETWLFAMVHDTLRAGIYIRFV